MTNQTLNQAIQQITTTLQMRQGNTISGAILGELIPKVCPELRVREVINLPSGPGALKKFIAMHLDHVLTISGKQGSDVVYTINGNKPAGDEQSMQSVDPELWNTFVRTGMPRILILRGNELSTIDRGEDSPSDGKIITSATREELNAIRGAFVNELGKEAEALPDLSAPYADWSSALREIGREQYKRWTEYRLNKIQDLFDLRLEGLNVESRIRSELCAKIRRSQLATRATALKNSQPTVSRSVSNQTSAGVGIATDENRFRQAIYEVVQQLSLAELRAIVLPAGAVADALNRQAKK